MSMQTNPLKPTSNSVYFALVLNLGAIYAMSIFGREIEKLVKGILGSHIATTITAILLGMSIAAFMAALKSVGWQRSRWLLLLIPLVFVLKYPFPIIAERVHFILFGAFGFIATFLTPWQKGILICLLASISDEVLQYFLPKRYGEIRDVLLNISACGLGFWAGMVRLWK